MTDRRERSAAAAPFSGRTAWARSLQTPLREFLRTETGGAAVLLAAAVVALGWANLHASSYEAVWGTPLSVRVGDRGVAQDLRHWVNNGLMTLFFFVVGLEARREFDMGELRERRRLALPLAAGVGGMVVPVAVYVAWNAGDPAVHGWGVAMSTDTAFALGMLALVGRRFPGRLRTYLLTVTVVDDIVALAVIATVYSEGVSLPPLLAAFGIFGVILLVRAGGVRYGPVYALLGAAAWMALYFSGVEPIVVGLAMGLLTYAYPAARTDLERATEVFRLFREQPTPELARSAQTRLVTAISPNERLQLLYHPWTSYVIVPLFALANAGIVINGEFLTRAYTSRRHHPSRRGCRLRRPERGLRHAHVLHQRTPAPRCLRHRYPLGCREDRPKALRRALLAWRHVEVGAYCGVAVKPGVSSRSARRKSTTIGMVITTDPAMSTVFGTSALPASWAMLREMVQRSRRSTRNSSANRYSFQAIMKTKNPVAMTEGAASGKVMRRSTPR
jgi:Na+/H+ antiporter NhaA